MEDPIRMPLIKQALSDQSIEAAVPEPLWKKVSNTTINVNLGFSPILPFKGARIEKHIGSGWIPVERRADGLYVNSRKVILYLSKRQQGDKWLKGYELRDELSGKPVLNANIFDALCENQHLIPRDWNDYSISYVFFWGTIYHDAADNPWVSCLCFGDDEWYRFCYRLDSGEWNYHYPAAMLAS